MLKCSRIWKYVVILLLCGSCHSNELPNATAPSVSPPEAAFPLVAESWNVLYNGFGAVTFENGTITLLPQVATVDGETHAALVLSKCQVRNFEATFRAT